MKKITIFIIIIICVSNLVGCVQSETTSTEIPKMKPIKLNDSNTNIEKEKSKYNNSNCSNSESLKEESSYDLVDLYKPFSTPTTIIVQAINDIYNLKEETDLSMYDIDLNKFQNSLLKSKLNYNVELFYLEYFEIDHENQKVRYYYGFDKDEISIMKEKLNAEVNIFLNTINPSMTDLEKELAIHDYIINNTSYDDNGFDNMKKIIISGSCYGTLVEKKAVCTGYSKAFNLLCKVSGLEAFSLIATGHAWNIVNIDGEYYEVDVLWDDINWGAGIDYKYFNLSSKKMDETHSKFSHSGYEWINDIYPKSTSKKYDNLNNQYNIIRDDEYFYYTDFSKSNIAKINIKTGNKIYIEKITPNEITVENDWIYYVNNDDSYLYKVKTNGEDNQLLVEKVVYGLYKKDGKIYYIENATNIEKEI